MNKLFTKVAALTLGVAMAAGVGVALGSAKVSEAKAAEETVTLDFATAGLTAFDSGTVNQGLSYTYVKDSGTSNPVFTKASGEAQHSLKLYNGNYLCIEINDTTSYGSFKSIQCKVTSKNGSTSGSGTYYKDSLTSTSLYTHTLTSGTFVDGNTVDVDGASKIYIKCSAGQYRIGKFVIVMNKQGDVPSTQYNVTDSVENGSVSPSTVSEGATLNATITPDTGYNVPETVSVTMGGVAATHTYENGVVTVQNVTGDVEITGSCVEIPVTPEPAVVETTFADFIAATDADYAKAYHFSATIKAFKSGDTKDKYGNMTLTDGTTDLTVYGSTADATKLVWNGVSEKYEFTNPQDFMTTDLTNDSNIGDTVEVKFVRYFHSSVLNAQGIILSVTPGETPEIPEPEMVTGKKLSDLFADTAGNGKQLYEVTGVVSNWKDSTSTDATKYGNFYLKESLDSDVEYYIYGATADATKLVWGTASGVYSFDNPKDFLTNEVTKDVVIGSTLTMRLSRCDYGTKLEANGIVVSVVPPAPTAWTTEQEQIFKDNLDGYVPPYFAELSGDIEVYTTLVQYNVKSDVVEAVNLYYKEQGWKSDVPGYWSHETTGGNGVVVAYAQTSATGTLLSFQYTEYAVVTLDENGTKTEVKLVPPVEYTLPSPTASLIPEGKEFKAWEIAGVEYQPEAKVSVSEDVTITAVYVDKVQTDWTDAQKAALETALHGYLPPFFGELAEDMTTTENSAVFTVSGDHTAEFASKLGDGWNLVSDNNYMKIEDSYYLTASIYKYGVRLPVGDYSEFTFTYYEGQPAPTNWSDEMLEAFETYLHGVVPTYDDSVKTLAYVSQYGDFEMPGTTQDVATANLATLCQGQGWEEENGKFYKDTEDGMGYVVGYVYNNSGSYEVTIQFVQTSYSQEMKDQFAAKMHGNIPPFLMFSDFEWVEADALFASIQYTSASNLTQFQNALTNGGFTLVTQENTSRYVTVAQDYLDGVLYQYAASLQDGGVLVFEVFVYANYALFTNIGYKAQPLSISVSGEYKDVYEYGEEFDPTGIVINAVMSDETVVDVTESAQFNGFDSTVAGVQTITVVVGNVQTTFDVTINEKPAPAYDADAFAKDLLEMVAPICANYDGKKNNKVALKTVWDTMSQRYSTLSNEEKAKVIAAAAKADGTDLEKAMAFYNYACKKYGLTKFIEGRQVKALVAEHETGNSILPIVVIVASSVAAITAIGVVIALKRRKALLAK